MAVKDLLRLDSIAGKTVLAAWKNLGKGEKPDTFRWKDQQTGEVRVQKTQPGSREEAEETKSGEGNKAKEPAKTEKKNLTKIDSETKKAISEDLGKQISEKIKTQLSVKDEGTPDVEDKTQDMHKLSIKQVTDDTMVSINGGEQKKFSDLSDEEKDKVTKAVESGKAKHKGFNDYSKVDVKTLQSNIQRNLDRVADKSVEEKKNIATEKVISFKEESGKEKESEEKRNTFIRKARENCQSVIDKYAGKITSKESKEFVNKHLENTLSCMNEALKEGSLAPDVTEADLDEFIREDFKRLFHQEAETKRRSVGDHGIRHLVANASNTLQMLDQLKSGGNDKVNGKMKLMGLTIQVNHDIGYTVGDVAYDAKSGKKHKNYSGDLARQEKGRYEKIFGKEAAEEICGSGEKGKEGIIQNHDESDYDWDNHPLNSSVALADVTSLFGKDKVQDLFLRNDKAMGEIMKIRMLMDTYPKKPKKPDMEKLRKDGATQEEIDKQMADYDTDLKNDKEIDGDRQRAMIESKARKIKKNIKAHIDDSDYDEYDKKLLHQQVDEIDYDFTSKDILSRYSGVLQGFEYDKDKKFMKIKMKFSPEAGLLRRTFGNDISEKQFTKFAEGDLKSVVEWKDKNTRNFGTTSFVDKSNTKRIQMDIDGFDEAPINSAATETMKNFMKHTIRDDLNEGVKILYGEPPPSDKDKAGEAKDSIMKSEETKKIMSEGEKKKLMELFEKYADNPQMLIQKLRSFPLTEKENAFMLLRGITSMRRGSGRKFFASGLEDLSKDDRNKLLDMVKDKLLSQAEKPAKTAVNHTGKGFKDKDLMDDTGGKSKIQRDPDFKPPRRENKGRFNTDSKNKDNRDTVGDKD